MLALRRVLARAVSGKEPFVCRCEGCGAFPNPQIPRVLWAGLAPSSSLHDLQQAVDEGTASLGWPREIRSFSPHLTRARARQAENRDDVAPALAEGRPQYWGDLSVDAVLLVESRLTPAGPVYTTLDRFPLGADAPNK